MKLTIEQKTEIKNLIEEGVRTAEISERMGLHPVTIQRFCKKSNLKINRSISKTYTLDTCPNDLKQLVLGSLLGDGCFTKACKTSYCMTLTHCEKQLSYLQYKSIILEKYNLSPGINKTTVYDKRYQHYYTGYRLRSRTNPLFKEIRDKFYGDKSKNIVDTTIFEELDAQGLAFWYLDDGYVTTYSCVLSTVSIPLESQARLAEILLKKFNLHFTIGHNDNSMYLCSSDFNMFKDLISPYVPVEMKYKLVPYEYRVLYKSDELLESCDANQQPSLGSA